ncbi:MULTISPECIES: PRD domain-containing protein [Bacillaceae]|uniref:PRD domain-containing protein n=1 Tax=Bacillaceae TaxID=186817 RepID=UPI001CDADB5C|nr:MULTISPECIES: PRD domain-containing protein [Bacillaceae]MED4473943.1 PRD domain-containing protein [Oceanobacillus caeni]
MIFKKRLNNNVVLVTDQDGSEKIVFGKGIGFTNDKDGRIDESRIEKIFSMDTPELTAKYSKLITNIPMEHIEFTESMIELIHHSLDRELDSNIYINLTDHISFAISRSSEQQFVKNMLLPEIKSYYSKEFEISLKIVNEINNRFGLSLPEDEAGFITMHIVNAELGESDSRQSIRIMNIVKQIMDLITTELDMELDESSMDYSRLLVHVKFFAHRIVYNKQWNYDDPDDFLNESHRNSLPYQLAQKVINDVEQTNNIRITNDELSYLAIHINRLLKNNNIPY